MIQPDTIPRVAGAVGGQAQASPSKRVNRSLQLAELRLAVGSPVCRPEEHQHRTGRAHQRLECLRAAVLIRQREIGHALADLRAQGVTSTCCAGEAAAAGGCCAEIVTTVAANNADTTAPDTRGWVMGTPSDVNIPSYTGRRSAPGRRHYLELLLDDLGEGLRHQGEALFGGM